MNYINSIIFVASIIINNIRDTLITVTIVYPGLMNSREHSASLYLSSQLAVGICFDIELIQVQIFAN